MASPRSISSSGTAYRSRKPSGRWSRKPRSTCRLARSRRIPCGIRRQLGLCSAGSIWTAAGYLGMTVEVLERTYGHHHPDYLYRGCRRHHREETNKDCRCLMPDGGHSSEDISGLEIAKETKYLLRHWSEWQDSNLRPLRPERPSPAANHCIFSLFRRLPTTLFAFRSRYSSGGIRGVAFGSLSSARLVKNILNHYPTGSIWKSSGRKGADFQDTRLWAVCTQGAY